MVPVLGRPALARIPASRNPVRPALEVRKQRRGTPLEPLVAQVAVQYEGKGTGPPVLGLRLALEQPDYVRLGPSVTIGEYAVLCWRGGDAARKEAARIGGYVIERGAVAGVVPRVPPQEFSHRNAAYFANHASWYGPLPALLLLPAARPDLRAARALPCPAVRVRSSPECNSELHVGVRGGCRAASLTTRGKGPAAAPRPGDFVNVSYGTRCPSCSP